MESNKVLSDFKRETADHKMEIIKDDGVFRHLLFSQDHSSIYHFTLTTWPGHLCIGGDMGTYVFSRLHDMFRFFRMDYADSQRSGGELTINQGYWAEKLQGGGGEHNKLYTEWSPEDFEERVQEFYDDWLAGAEDNEEITDEIKAEVLADINRLKQSSSYEYEALIAQQEFRSDYIDLCDFWECSCRDSTHSFVWCCFAIVWGIRQYDMRKLAEAAIDTALPILASAK